MKLNLSEMLKQFRKEKNYTQEDVASNLGVTYQAVSRWENGLSYPDIELLPSIAALFGVSLDKLFEIDKESEASKIEKYHSEDKEIEENIDEQIKLVKKFISETPNCCYFKFRLINLYHSMGLEKARKKLEEMRSLCLFIVDHSTDMDWYRDYAISRVIDVENEDRVNEWYSLLDNRSRITSVEAERGRYYYRGEVESFNIIMQSHFYTTLTETFTHDFCKLDAKSFKNAQSRVDGQKTILKIIDALRDPKKDNDAWIFDRIFALLRLSAGCFGSGYVEDGYAALKESIVLCLKLCEIPVGTELYYNSPALDLLTKKVEKNSVLRAINNTYLSYTNPEGGEWFNDVRKEEKYQSLVSKLKALLPNKV
ncbi:MAG: helix-turn-helix domain-containing protein [Clostridia bacterium]|nr:helix-turn-helix domain-containing protein [Clostridia bacterium]